MILLMNVCILFMYGSWKLVMWNFELGCVLCMWLCELYLVLMVWLFLLSIV